jgi:hypothetical protein
MAVHQVLIIVTTDRLSVLGISNTLTSMPACLGLLY